jgi:hypothetical protein
MPRKLSILLILIVTALGILAAYLVIRPQLTPEEESLADNGSTTAPAISPDENEVLFVFARCMQNNGLPEFPDPKDGGINLNGTGLDPNSPDFMAASEACESVRPQAPNSAQNERIVPGDSEWEKVVPGGDSKCADGSEFAFWVRTADPTKAVLFFEGGGACWDATTCAFTDEDSTTYDWNITGGDDPVFRGGIFDLANPDNPVADYSSVYVPYCTGDVHLGNRTQAYSPELTVAHNGFVNGSTALAYLVENYPDAQQILVSGVSAGSVAAPVYAGLVSDAFPEAQIILMADSSGAYPNDPNLNSEILGLWGTFETMPDWAENEGLTAEEWGIPRFWIQAGQHNPEIVMARFDYAFDQIQAAYMTFLDLDASNLIASIDANEALIEEAGVVQHSYTAPGSSHTVINNEEFYTMAVNGIALVDWVEALILGEPLDDVHCDECTVE